MKYKLVGIHAEDLQDWDQTKLEQLAPSSEGFDQPIDHCEKQSDFEVTAVDNLDE